jgi:hypothetical protein
MKSHRVRPAVALAAACLTALAANASDDATALRDRLAALEADIAAGAQTSTQLDALGEPIYLQSRESASHLDGEVWARIDYPLAELLDALGRADRWCEIMILHQNVKYCRSTREAGSDILYIGLGRKTFQELDDAHWLRFTFNNAESAPDLLRVELHAPSGPLSTTDYRLVLEAAPLSSGSSVLHFYYGYGFGPAGRLAMKSYLVTIGRDKVGFSTTGSETTGKPIYVSGVRGVLERNVMRYFLAIRAYLAAATRDGEDGMDDRLQIWFDATEYYPRQLHELERTVYMDMKAREIGRQQSVVYPPEGS